MLQKNWFDKARMVQWLLFSVLAYLLAMLLAEIPTGHDPDAGLYPRLQAVLWKSGHLNLGAFIGYWIGRTRLGRLTRESSDIKYLAHAIVIGMAMYAFTGAL